LFDASFDLAMIDLTRRRLLALGGNAAALGMLGGCESFSQSALLRSPVYDTSEADRASNSAAAAEPPADGNRPALPELFDDIERRTVRLLLGQRQSGQRHGAGSLPEQLAGEASPRSGWRSRPT
jgi:hypothetical protein